MTNRREARLHLPASQHDSSRSVTTQRLTPLVRQLAAQHGITLTPDTGLLEWLTQANVPVHHPDSPAYAAIAAVVQQLYTLSSPGGDDGGSR
ncbi:MAG: hypothetical protein COW59_12680 [Lysobacterales bacterium CG17_big_fil_post_rev_8_21_14_2_50_64_11]|nr:MAG: hypothetical protein COW59_12680 [Xanthomonadales bacterium CG17_big_fil_post_rev_8_21_14_2_50_64_11]